MTCRRTTDCLQHAVCLQPTSAIPVSSNQRNAVDKPQAAVRRWSQCGIGSLRQSVIGWCAVSLWSSAWLLNAAAFAQIPTLPPLPPAGNPPAAPPAGQNGLPPLDPVAPAPPATAPKTPGAAMPNQPATAQPAKPGVPGKAPAADMSATKPGATATAGGKTPGKKGEMTVQNLELMTKDGVRLRAFYFPSELGKDAVPVIIVHEWQGQGSPYLNLVKSLWNAGCAVIVPEYRGHGGSRSIEFAGTKKDFDIARMSKADVAKIIGADMEAVKKFLKEENNEKRLNLNALTLVGIREGAIIAAQWAVRDLNFPSVGQLKQGQDVKAMVLVSPEKILKGFTLDETLTDRLLWQLPFLVVVGRTSPQAAETERYVKRLETIKKRAAQGTVIGLDILTPNTSLAGPNLVNDAPGVVDKITEFVKTEVIAQSKSYPWIDRTK